MGDLLGLVGLLLAVVIMASSAYAAKVLRDRYNVEIEAETLARWRGYLERAVEFGLARAGVPIDIPDMDGDVMDTVKREGYGYLRRYAGDTLARVGVDVNDLNDLFEPIIREKRAARLDRFPPPPSAGLR